ncbi:MAG: M48 family metalloprotease [Chloroflexi bacterium]|nr:M48 family metalloprotease [Chloroflexota bacterium]
MQTQTVHSESDVQTIECANCDAVLPVDANYVTWCDRCGWNLQPQEVRRPRNLFEYLYASAGIKLSKSLFDEMVSAESLRPVWTMSKVLAFLCAAAIHALTVGFALLGLALIIREWPAIILVAAGLLCLGVAWLLRPIPARCPEGVLPRGSFPTLYGVADEISRQLGAPTLDSIAIDSIFNAYFMHAGWRRRPTMCLGLPLLSILSGPERVGLMAHEIAHGVNGDPFRGFFVGSAVDSLISWHVLLRPDRLWEPGVGFFMALALVPINLLALGLSEVALLMANALIHLSWLVSQRAEYLADYLAASVAGTEAVLALLDKLHFVGAFECTVLRASLNWDRQKQDVFEELRKEIGQMPERELERLRRVKQMESSRLDVTHPPTTYRLRLLAAHPMPHPKLTLPPEVFDRLDCELATLKGETQEKLLDQQRASLYRRYR